jgi:stage III sporulation protein AE
MKKKLTFRKLMAVLTIFILLLMFGSASIIAVGEGYGEELNQTVIDQINKLDLQALQDYVDSLDDFSKGSIAERLLEYINATPMNYDTFFAGIMEIFLGCTRKLVPIFATIAAITLLCGIVTSLRSNFLSYGSGETVFFACYLSVLIPILAVVIECFSASKACVLEMQKQMQIIFPIMLTLMATSGGSVSAAIYRPAVAFLSNAIVSLICDIIFPLTLTIIAFTIIGNLLKELNIERFTSFFKSINKWIIGVSVSVFGLFFTLQGLTAASYDGIARRAAKYAIGTGVPIVGGFLSGGFDLAIAGSILIKNSLGTMSVFLLLFVLLEPILLLIASNTLLRLTAAVTQPIGDGRISNFLTATADNLNYCVAGVLFVSFLYFISIILISCSAEMFL